MGGGRKGKKSKKTKTKAQKMAVANKAKYGGTAKAAAANRASMKAKAKTYTKSYGAASTAAANKAANKVAAGKRYQTSLANKALSKAGGTSAQVAKDNKQYGNTVPSGSFNISAAGKEQAAANKQEKAAADMAARSQNMFSPPSGTNYGGITAGRLGTTFGDMFSKPKFMYQGNFAGRAPGVSNYFATNPNVAATYTRPGGLKGIPFAKGDVTGSLTRFNVPEGAKITRNMTGFQQLKLNPNQMKNLGMGLTVAGDDVAGVAAKSAGKFGVKTLGKFGARAIPFAGAGLSIADSISRFGKGDYTGAALAAGSAIPGPVGWASLGGLAAKDIASAMSTQPTTPSGGLNIGAAANASETGEGTSESNSLGRALSQPNVVKGFGKDALNLSRLSLDRFLTPSLADGTLTGQMDFAGRLPGQQDFDSRDQVAMKAYDAATKSEGVKALAGNAGIDMGAADKALKALGPYGSEIRAGDRDATYEPLSKLAVDIGARDELAPVSRAIRAGFDKEATPMSIARAAFNPNAEGIPSISQKELGIAGGVGNRLLSGKATDAVREATVGYGDREGAVNAGLTPGSALSLGQMFDTGQALAQNVQNPNTLAAQRFDEGKRLVGAGGKVTAGSLIRGSLPSFGGRRGSSGSTTPTRGTGTTGTTTPMEELLIPQTPTYTAPTQTGTDTSNLQQIQQQSYMQNLAQLGITNLMQLPQFRTQQQRAPRRFRSFRRDYF
tara:strand:+ start:646 stop:2817 length:2172 start_codon:yes stop_codon:yes gene_type:complete